MEAKFKIGDTVSVESDFPLRAIGRIVEVMTRESEDDMPTATYIVKTFGGIRRFAMEGEIELIKPTESYNTTKEDNESISSWANEYLRKLDDAFMRPKKSRIDKIEEESLAYLAGWIAKCCEEVKHLKTKK